MGEKFERSPEIQEKIDTVRSLPQGQILRDTPENREKIANNTDPTKLYAIRDTPEAAEIGEINAAKKLEAHLLRQELMWGHAHLVKTTFEEIAKNPAITSEELWQKCLDTGKVLNPLVLSRFGETILERIEDTNNYYDTILENASDAGLSPEVYLFQTLLSDDAVKKEKRGNIFPKHPVKITKHPLAVQIELDEEDFSLIDPETNVGGFFRAKHYLDGIEDPDIETGGIIAVKISEDPRSTRLIYKHEEGHAYQNVVDTVLAFGKESNQEAMNIEYFTLGSNAFRELGNASSHEQMVELYKTDEKVRKGIDIILDYCITYASDELLAEKNTGAPLRSYMDVLRESELYDYVGDALDSFSAREEALNNYRQAKDRVHVTNTADIKDFLTDLYITKLEKATESAIKLDNFYMTFSSERAALLREALRIIPIQDWNEFLTDSMCMAEITEWRETQNHLGDVQEPFFDLSIMTANKFELSDEANDLYQRFAALDKKVSSLKTTAVFTPMYKQLVQYNSEAEELELEMTELPEYQAMILCTYVKNLGAKIPDGRRTEFELMKEEFGNALVASKGDPSVLAKYRQLFFETFV